ncbi:UNVERIFIED_CONTAM: RHOMBOID-like protein 2 [Sesamum angustifolium]|uniref:RHOMBOID-like protein n=1 Tax=Sesamum angustifolium TaxID=2727405 RepID=A0AAW2MKB8_9LAMI
MVGNGDLERGTATKNRNQSYPQTYYAAGGGRVYDMEYSDSQWTSWLVPMIVVANVAMFVVIMFVNNCPKNHDGLQGDCVVKFLGRLSFQPLRENPLFGPSSSTLEKLGALEWNKIVHQNQAWRLITCIWLHAGVIHLLANMLSLVFIGIRLEQQFGFIRVGWFTCCQELVGAYCLLYLFTGVYLLELLVLCLDFLERCYLLLTNWTGNLTNKAAALFTLVVIIAINLAVGILPHVDNFAHIGGFLSGFLLGFILLIRPQFGWLEQRNRPAETRLKSKYTVYQYVFWIIASVLLIVGFTVGLVMLFKGENGNDKCSWCHYLSCVPTSRWSCNN